MMTREQLEELDHTMCELDDLRPRAVVTSDAWRACFSFLSRPSVERRSDNPPFSLRSPSFSLNGERRYLRASGNVSSGVEANAVRSGSQSDMTERHARGAMSGGMWRESPSNSSGARDLISSYLETASRSSDLPAHDNFPTTLGRSLPSGVATSPGQNVSSAGCPSPTSLASGPVTCCVWCCLEARAPWPLHLDGDVRLQACDRHASQSSQEVKLSKSPFTPPGVPPAHRAFPSEAA